MYGRLYTHEHRHTTCKHSPVPFILLYVVTMATVHRGLRSYPPHPPSHLNETASDCFSVISIRDVGLLIPPEEISTPPQEEAEDLGERKGGCGRKDEEVVVFLI